MFSLLAAASLFVVALALPLEPFSQRPVFVAASVRSGNAKPRPMTTKRQIPQRLGLGGASVIGVALISGETRPDFGRRPSPRTRMARQASGNQRV
jgi:hypothetical protein